MKKMAEEEMGLNPPFPIRFRSLGWSKGLGEREIVNLGFILDPIFDRFDDYRLFCPSKKDYEGHHLYLKVLGKVLGVDTEALYLGQTEKRSLVDEEGNIRESPRDYLLIRESILKKIWFEMDGGSPKYPPKFYGRNKVQFYYPPDPDDPFTKKSFQEIYTINRELPKLEFVPVLRWQTQDTGIGCIPKLK